ncbi:MAG: UbiA family prenyltransferase [Planctomycetota bacterium]
MSRARDWLELGRVSNLPTVWSNVVHGMSVGLFVAVVLPVEKEHGQIPPVTVDELGRMLDQGFMLLLGISLLYVGGMVLNDACDAAEDGKQRPSRPIPSGRVPRRAAAVAAIVLLGAGWACTLVYAVPVPFWAGVLGLAIVGYNLLHRWWPIGFVLMAACRGLVVWTAASAIGFGMGYDDDLLRVAGSAVAVACYTLAVTLIAWGEALPTMKQLSKWVGVMIALMPILDAVFLWQFGMLPMAAFCIGCAALSLAGQRWIAGS